MSGTFLGLRLSPLSRAGILGGKAIALTGIMMRVGTLEKTRPSVAGAGWAIFLVFSMVGGGMVPLFAMPAWMRAVASFSPVKWAILSFEGAIWRGFSSADLTPGCGILLAAGLAAFGLGAWRLARADN